MICNYRTISSIVKTQKIILGNAKFLSQFIHGFKTSLRMASNLSDPKQPQPAEAPASVKAKLRVYPSLIKPELLRKVLSDEVQRLMECFSEHGYSTSVVGGAVRDLAIGQVPHDLDLCTDATPEEMQNFLKKQYHVVPIGQKYGTLLVVLKDENIEVTTLRVDKVTDGRHAEVEFTRQWEIDAERRDFTINALYMDRTGTVLDYFSGVEDLKARRILFVKDADQRIQEDYLRILRYFRFYGRINEGVESHDAGTLEAIRKNAEGLKKISKERVWSEMQRILPGKLAPQLVQVMYQLGVALQIDMPQPGNVEELERVWTLHANGKHKLAPVTLLMALVDGGDEHSVGEYCSKWKMSTVEKKHAITIVTSRNVESDNFVKYCKDMLLDRTPIASVLDLMVYKGRPESEVSSLANWDCPEFTVTGHDLMKLGLSGKEVGIMKEKLNKIWRESDFLTSKEQLLELAVQLMKD